MIDDPRVELGDIIQLSDGSRVYVTGFSRDLTFGAAATLDITRLRAKPYQHLNPVMSIVAAAPKVKSLENPVT